MYKKKFKLQYTCIYTKITFKIAVQVHLRHLSANFHVINQDHLQKKKSINVSHP